MTPHRMPEGGSWIDRSRPITFRFDGVEYQGFEGDTLASALLANGTIGGFRSPILGRPRGVMTAGPEEPNAFVEISEPWFDPIAPATMVELVDGLVARPRAGVGELPTAPVQATRAVHRHAHVETLVVGAGIAGLAAAGKAVQRGDRVMIADERHAPIGLAPADGLTVLPRTTVTGLYDDGYAVALERSGGLERAWHVRAKRVVLATGAHERPIAFPGNDLPGVMLGSAVLDLVTRFGVVPGQRAVVWTTNHSAYATADALRTAGIEVAAIVDAAAGGSAQDGARAAGFDAPGCTVSRASGDGELAAVNLADPTGAARDLEADLLVVSGGWNPTVQLARAIGALLRYDERRACFVPDPEGLPPWLEVVGAAAGDVPTSEPLWFVDDGEGSDAFVDLQRDQTVADVRAATGAGLRSVEHVKRATYIGTAIDQGRTSNVLTAEIVNAALADPPGAQGPTSARPPYTPVSFAALAGFDRGELLDPVRVTPIQPWHLTHDAVFEDVGQWKRPRFFPRDGEDMEAAVLRECAAVREAAGLLDASTLGKIEVIGPDAATFLDRMYTNRMSTLDVGRIRYGLMVGLDGMVVDDGTVTRLADDRFFVTTTTGNAAMVLDRFEEWLQTEWPDLRAWCTSVTEQWATAAVGGPRARDVLAAVGTDLALDPGSFPLMTVREGTVAGVPARVARISFTGELSFEVSVDGRLGLHVWERLIESGEPFGLTPYGTETMHVLRAEKGYPIVGQDTDGTVTPDDLGLSWMVRKDDSDFIGRRSLSRPDCVRPGRKQFVGLLPDDPGTAVAEGAQLVSPDADLTAVPVLMLGHVTSSYRSAALGRTFALAMLERGRERIGSSVLASFAGRTMPCEVVPPVLVDPEGLRRDG